MFLLQRRDPRPTCNYAKTRGVSLAERETSVQTKAAPTRDLFVSLQKREARVKRQVAKEQC